MKNKMLAMLLMGAMVFGMSTAVYAEETESATESTTEAVTEAAEAETDEETTEAAQDESEAAEAAAEEEAKVPDKAPEYTAGDYVTVGQYKGLVVDVEPQEEVTDLEVKLAIGSDMQSSGIGEVVTEGTVEPGDLVVIDYEGKKDGVAFEGGTAQDAELLIGSNSFIDGFEDGLVGVKVGDTVDLNLTFPEVYHSAELAGQDVVFTVTVKGIKKVTDANVSELTGGAHTTAAAYEAAVKEEVEEANAQAYENSIFLEIMKMVYNTCPINEYPEDVVAYYVAAANELDQEYAEMYGLEYEDYLTQAYGMTKEEYDEAILDYIKQTLQQELVLKAIAEEEGMWPMTEDTYQEGCKRYLERQGLDTVADLEAQYGRDTIERSLMIDNVMYFLRDEAVVAAADAEKVVTADEEATEAESEEVVQ